jgi:hypothetical protein
MMKQFLIKYRLQNLSAEAWHKDVADFIAALDSDPALRGKISYRCMKSRDGSDYFHLAVAADEAAVKALQQNAVSRAALRKSGKPPAARSTCCRLRSSPRRSGHLETDRGSGEVKFDVHLSGAA